ncbi:MAG TPA: hypothetical protein VMT62_01365 [Syntrophorhabdaceae bacterium]|nr:hypothetical protein [Syntrophorhabdaceae bacterium]
MKAAEKSMDMAKEFAPANEIKAKLSAAQGRLTAIQARIGDQEAKIASLSELIEAVRTKKAACIDAIAGGAGNHENLEKLRRELQQKTSEVADEVEILAALRRAEEPLQKEVGTLSAELIPAYREAWYRVAVSRSERVRTLVGDEILTIFAAIQLAGGSVGVPPGTLATIFYPDGWHYMEVTDRMGVLRTENGI